MTKQEIYNILASHPNVKVQNDIQIRTKCFLCGDSAKNPNKKRLGIKIDVHNPTEPILYQCFNCFQKGIFTVEMLHQMEVFDKDVETSIRELNKRATHDDGTRVNKYTNKKEIKVEYPPLYKEDIPKVKYLYDRIQYKIPMEDFNKLKIIFNLDAFLKLNNIRPNNDSVPLLTRDYIGFMSVNNEYIIFRDITNKNKFRWIKYNIFNVYDNTNSFYTIKNNLNLLTTDTIKFSITEGPIDIISLHYNIFNGNNTNNIEISTCNGSMINPVKYYFKKGLVGSNIELDFYQDNDTRLDFKDVRNVLKPYIINSSNFHVYYNQLSKDFGVPKSNILIDELKIN